MMIELLTEKDGHAVPGILVEDNSFPRLYTPDEEDPEYTHAAYLHKFVRLDRCGRAVPETMVRYYVPDYLLENGHPTEHARRLVAERQGW